MTRLPEVPLIVVVIGLTGLAMLGPAGFGLATGDHMLALSFAQSAAIVFMLALILGAATRNHRPRDPVRSQFLSLLGAYLAVPVLAALPITGQLVFPLGGGDRLWPLSADANGLPPAALLGLPQSFRPFDAWFEMVSSFTTTGATLLDRPHTVAPGVHLWRAMVGWFGGFFVLFAAFGMLAPVNLGGVEVETGLPPGRAPGPTPLGRMRVALSMPEPSNAAATGASPALAPARRPARPRGRAAGMARRLTAEDAGARLAAAARVLFPVYAGLTLGLWLGLILAGDSAFVALCHAMSVLATSGISPVGGMEYGASSRAGEALVLLCFAFALSRRCLPGPAWREPGLRLYRDVELRAGIVAILAVTLLLTLRQWSGAAASGTSGDWAAAVRAFWGSFFTAASFLSTTGFVSADWAGSRLWSGLAPPGLALAGLALLGGGVATTAGGIGLLRAYALYKHGRHEMDKLIHPSLVGGEPPRKRRIRSEGAFAAWLALMMVIVVFTAVIAGLSLAGLGLEPAMILAAAALSTTGPLAAMVASGPVVYSALDDGVLSILGLAMVLGRLELLAVLALLMPDAWRA